FFFFFSSRRRHTRFSRDWSSDVCSSDLLFQAGNQTAVGQTVLTSTSVDTSDPQSAELTLALTAVAVGVLASLDYRLLGNTEHTRTSAVIAFGEFQNFLVTATSYDATLNTSHELFLCS